EQLYAAGNISQLQLNREQIAASEASVEQHKAEVQAGNKYSVLLNLLGLQRGPVKIDERLPLPVDQQLEVSALQDSALAQRLDISAMREALKSTQQQLNHARHWRWLGGVEVGVEREHDKGDAAATGPAASLEIPLFNQGGGAVMRKRAKVETLTANIASAELSTRNNIVSQLAALTHAKQVVDQYQHSVVPLHDQVIALTRQRFNYMLIGAPELLLAKQQALNAHQAYLESVGDYWLAYAELQRIAGGRLPGDSVATHTFIQLDDANVDTSSATSFPHH
ncbi:MAG: TolC family protein, partial [Steroidobacter sp.]